MPSESKKTAAKAAKQPSVKKTTAKMAKRASTQTATRADPTKKTPKQAQPPLNPLRELFQWITCLSSACTYGGFDAVATVRRRQWEMHQNYLNAIAQTDPAKAIALDQEWQSKRSEEQVISEWNRTMLTDAHEYIKRVRGLLDAATDYGLTPDLGVAIEAKLYKTELALSAVEGGLIHYFTVLDSHIAELRSIGEWLREQTHTLRALARRADSAIEADMLTQEQASEIADCSAKTIRDWIGAGKLTGYGRNQQVNQRELNRKLREGALRQRRSRARRKG